MSLAKFKGSGTNELRDKLPTQDEKDRVARCKM